MSVRQVLLACTGEGTGDLYVLPRFIERLLEDWLAHQRKDLDVLPVVWIPRPDGLGFQEWMHYVEGASHGMDAVIVHQDADRNSPRSIREGRWADWLTLASEPSRWILALPVQTTEAWLLADHETLADTLDLPTTTTRDVVGRSSKTDKIRQPKQLVHRLRRIAEADQGRRIRYGTLASEWAERASLERCQQRSQSLRRFYAELSSALTDAVSTDP